MESNAMNDWEEKKKQLMQTPVFRDMPEYVVGEVARVVEAKTVPRGTTLFRKGEPGDSFWMIETGKVRVFRQDEEGVELTLSELGPGQSFGEMALLTGEPRSANVETVEESQVMVLAKEQFDRVLKSHPDVSLTFIKQLSTWLKRDEQALVMEAKRLSSPPRMSWFDFVLLFGVSMLFALVFNQSNPNGISLFPNVSAHEKLATISLSAAAEEHRAGETLFLDAMPANFYERSHIQGAENMPLTIFDFVYMMMFEGEDKSKKIIVYGRTVSKLYDVEVANKLILRGYNNVRLLDGGLRNWEKQGYPVEAS
jgi:rhodanese-related sulfurtransferase